MEPREPPVALDVAEYGLHVDPALLPEGRPPLRMQHPRCLLPAGIGLRVDAERAHGVRILGMEALLPERASGAVAAPVDPDILDISEPGLRMGPVCEAEPASMRTLVLVGRLVVLPVRRAHGILAPLPVPAFPEELGVLHACIRALRLEPCMVLLRSVSRICHDLLRQASWHPLRMPGVRDGACGVSRPLAARGVDDELALGARLHVACGLELPVAHMIVLHAHERGVAVGLRERSPAAEVFEAAPVALHAPPSSRPGACARRASGPSPRRPSTSSRRPSRRSSGRCAPQSRP